MTTPFDEPDNRPDTMLSRSGSTDAGGKLTRRIDVPMSEEMEGEVITMATLAGIPKAEWMRRMVERTVHGELGMVRRMAQGGSAGNGRSVGGTSDAE